MPFDPDAAASRPSSDTDEQQYHHHLRHRNNTHLPFPFGYPPSTTSGFLRQLDDSSINHINNINNNMNIHMDLDNSGGCGDSGAGVGRGGYSPPAWRRLGNGDRSSGFWRKGGDNLLGYGGLPPELDYDSVDECDDDDDDVEEDDILAAAIRTRLPTGSMSPEKERSPEPEWRGGGGGGGGGIGSGGGRYYRGKGANGNGAAGDVRVKSEEPDADDIKATLAALPPHKDESENCTYSFHPIPTKTFPP